MTDFESLPEFAQLPSEIYCASNLGVMVVSNRVDQLRVEHHPAAIMKSLLIALSLTCSYGLAKAEKQQTFSTETT
jgi:hypothetical protein